MTFKRIAIASIAAFALIFLFDWILHSVVLRESYAQTQNLWRTNQEMRAYFPVMVLGQLIAGLALALIVFLAMRVSGLPAALAAGFLLGLLAASNSLETFSVQPLPSRMVLAWILAAFVKYTAVAFAVSFFFHPGPEAPLPGPAITRTPSASPPSPPSTPMTPL